MTTQDFDLFIIGAGSGGVRAARIAASHGARVAIAEDYRVGGTCVIRGCVPKKLLVYASRFADDFEDAAGFGWEAVKPEFSWERLIAAKDKEIARLEAAYRGTLERHKVELIEGRATIDGANRIRIAGRTQTVTAGKILIATGGAPFIDRTLKGHEHAITSNEAFHLTSLPSHIIIEGGGYIAVEFACIFRGLGANVTLVYRGSKILRGFDDDLRDALIKAMTARGIRILTGRKMANLSLDGLSRQVVLDDGTLLKADQVMLATGRKPAVQGLGLETAGVMLSDNGGIAVDAWSKTSAPSIYAVGDVTNRVNLTPIAIREGHAFADTVYGSKPWSVAYDTIATAVFSTPEIGTVGLGEQAAIASGHTVRIFKTEFRPMRATLAGRSERMLMKLVVDAATDRVLGVHVLGDDAAEIVQMAAIAVKMGATKADFDRTIALHPSAAEELVTLR